MIIENFQRPKAGFTHDCNLDKPTCTGILNKLAKLPHSLQKVQVSWRSMSFL